MLNRLIIIMDRLLAVARTGSLWLARLGGLLLIATVIMVVVEIAMRGLLGFSLGASTELSGYVLAISASWAFAHALFLKAHIRIDVVYLQLPQALRAAMDVLALVTFVLFSAVVARAAWGVAAESLSRGSLANTPLHTPLWIPQALWLLGLVWFCLAVVLLLVRVGLALLARDTQTVQSLAGSPTLDEQIRSEGGEIEETGGEAA